jgi:crossover junction endodeoxyribonuclease RuvC
MIVCGIDCGKQGAIVFLKGQEVIMHKMPEDYLALARIISEAGTKDISVFVEKAQCMPQNGAVGMFNYGVGFGVILGILTALKIPYTLVPPKTWTKEMHLGTKGSEPKEKSLEAARRLYPEVNLIRERCRKPDEGYVDALLIAAYGQRVLRITK